MDAEIIETKQALRRMHVGAEAQEAGVHFRVWAPGAKGAAVVFEDGAVESCPLRPERDGYFSALVASARPGAKYRFRLEGKPGLYPDPASRWQPEGPHGPSVVTDASTFSWTDRGWTGIAADEHAIYEMHIGTFTTEGTWCAAAEQLPGLRDLGITTIEMMPVAEFAGDFGWGYDGVNLFAPSHLYGRPDDLKYFVDRAHAEGLAVILDVVYNHLGPDGNYLSHFTPDYFGRITTEWGDGFNLSGENSSQVRRFLTSNAAYWIDEFHFDGLRLDATQQIFDASQPHIIADIATAARKAAGGRKILLLAENEPQDARLIRSRAEGGYGLDALYNDDFHHAAIVAMCGRREAYYMGYFGAPQEFVSLAKRGFLYQGQFDKWQGHRRGKPALDRGQRQFVIGIENHDQVANSGRGRRIHQLTSPGRLRAMTAAMLLFPQIPMLFQGQEFGASAGFLYFAGHAGELAQAVRAGRTAFMSQFPSHADPAMQALLPAPDDPEAFRRSKLDLRERAVNREAYALHKDLLHLRRSDAVFRRAGTVDGSVLEREAFVIRFFGSEGDDRLLLVNMGQDLQLHPAPEPLLAPPERATWELLWSSEHPRYGGCGTPGVETATGWRLPAQAALVMKAEAR